MNRTYRQVWNRTLRTAQAASEVAHSRENAASGAAASVTRSHLLALAGAATLALGGLGFALPAQATPYVLTFTQQGSNVVAHGSGAFDLADLTYLYQAPPPPSLVSPTWASVQTGATVPDITAYTGSIGITGFSGPSNFGNTPYVTFADDSAGDNVGLIGTAVPFQGINQATLFVPNNYVTGSDLASTSTWNNADFAYLGVNPGSYVWAWGPAAEQSFTIDVVAAVPEPGDLGMLGLGLAFIGGIVVFDRRWRSQTAEGAGE